MQFKRIFAFIGAVLTWFAIITQFDLMMQNRAAPVGETIIRFFSFFTILTNTLVAIYFTQQFLPEKFRSVLLGSTVFAFSIAVYITIVGLVYQFALRHLWQPAGLQWIVDELLHSIVPLLYLIFWFLYRERHSANWKWMLKSVIFPLLYLVFILTRGRAAEFYPYPFVDVSKLGINEVLFNAAILVMVFLFFMWLFISVSKFLDRKEMPQPVTGADT